MIGFPGIGLEFQRNPVIFRITDTFAWTWYGTIVVAGIILAVIYCMKKSKSFGISEDELLDMLFAAIPAGIIGSRLYYVAFNWNDFRDDTVSILFTWHGGMTIHGAIIGSVAAAALFCWVRRINIGAMLDLGAMGLLIGQAVGRWGNFVNGEVYGKPTDLPWRMRVHGQEVHPLFLYECLWNILGLVILRLIMKRRKYNGQMFTVYVAWYGLGRGLMEGMRASEFNMMAGEVMISRVVAIVSCVAALALLAGLTLLKKHPPLLEWTAERDEYAEYRKTRKKGAPQQQESETEDRAEAEETIEEESADDGDIDGREDTGQEGQE
jgi:phosphatidylglycerol:prolipoprotein diacylglycerol transferase